MIRYSTQQKPEVWHTVEIELEDTPEALDVRYRLLPMEDASARRQEMFRLGAEINDDSFSEAKRLGMLAEQFSPEDLRARQKTLAAHITDWSLGDAQAEDPDAKLSVTATNLEAVLADPRFFGPLWSGLLDASLGAKKKR